MASQAARSGAGNSAGGGRYKLDQYKLVLLGESAVGKSSLVSRFVKGHFKEFEEPTNSAALGYPHGVTQTVDLGDTTFKFEILDTASQGERFHSQAAIYYRRAQAAIVVYDITKAETFTRARSWVDELHREARPSQDLVIALAGNKSDLGSRRTVEYEEANAYAEEKGLIFLETSAKNANNVNEIFLAIARKLPREYSGPRLTVFPATCKW